MGRGSLKGEIIMLKKSGESVLKRVHIISRKDEWAIKKEGVSKASKIYREKETAIKQAQKLRKNGYDVIVHKKDGSIQKWEESLTEIG